MQNLCKITIVSTSGFQWTPLLEPVLRNNLLSRRLAYEIRCRLGVVTTSVSLIIPLGKPFTHFGSKE